MKNELKYLQLALLFFTRLPLHSVSDYQAIDQSRAVKYFPLVGLIIGVLVALVFWLLAQFLPKEIAILLSMLAGLLLTGGFHEDGLADAVDGLGGGWHAEQVLRIMQDSRLGSYGALALVISLMLKYQTLAFTPIAFLPWTIIAGHTVSRFAALWLMTRLSYLRAQGKGRDIVSTLSHSERRIALLFCLLPLLFNIKAALVGLVPVILVWFYFTAILKKRLAGYTGDCLGAMQQITEISFYIGVLAWTN